jgi:hypothetical protein
MSMPKRDLAPNMPLHLTSGLAPCTDNAGADDSGEECKSIRRRRLATNFCTRTSRGICSKKRHDGITCSRTRRSWIEVVHPGVE